MATCTECKSKVPEVAGPDQPEYVGLCALCAWRKWFAPHATEWAKVECVECELGRECSKHSANR